MAIAFDGVSKSFGRHKSPARRLRTALTSSPPAERIPVLTDLNFTIRRGEAVGVIGANGAGKSTLLALAAGLLDPTTGTVSVEGPVAALLDLGGSFVPELSGRENARFFHEVVAGRGRLAPEQERTIADFARIGDHFDRPVRTYSSGMFLRLAFACATAEDPDVMLIDEVLTVGDAAFQQRCYRRLADLRAAGTTVLLVTHMMGSLAAVCERTLVLERGTITFDGATGPALDHYLRGHLLGAGGSTDDDATVRYGDGGARIDSPALARGPGGRTVVTLEIVAARAVAEPQVGVRCSITEGMPLYMTTTGEQGVQLPPLACGDRRLVEISLDLTACAGDLFLDLSVFEATRQGIQVLDQRIGVLHVVAPPRLRWLGFVDLDATFTIVPADRRVQA